ncbi:hypothetical protein KAR91_49715 [Candidatus Pacearchaeota archaeon]|nr:hypothetical protein [Candidatus Pacearchaeota archaeon]
MKASSHWFQNKFLNDPRITAKLVYTLLNTNHDEDIVFEHPDGSVIITRQTVKKPISFIDRLIG